VLELCPETPDGETYRLLVKKGGAD
jgi:hypothetical protein